MLDKNGVDPTSEVEFTDINDSAATVQAMESGEVDATIFSDYFVMANYKDDMRMICSIGYSPEFQSEACCVTAMNTDFIKENPVHAKYVTMAIKRGGEYNRLHSEDAVQAMYDNDKMTGDKDIQLAFWDGLHFGLSDKDLTVDDIMDMAWTETCPDEDMPEGYTVADPVEPEGAVVPVKAKENPAKLDGFGL